MKTLIALACAGLALAATPAATAKPDEAKGKGRDKGAAEHQHHPAGKRDYTRLGDFERRIVVDYYQRSDCPPGLAKKNNGCLPPGIAKKRYEIGRRLSDDIYVAELPYDIVVQLPVLPDRYGYRLIDGDLGVIELATLIVIDAIGLY